MAGLCLKCDDCGASLGIHDISPTPLSNVAQVALLGEAKKRGWTGPMTHTSKTDKCPACSKK